MTVYRVPRALVAARQGSIAVAADGTGRRVSHLGAAPGRIRLPARVRWSALVRVPQYRNYRLRVGPGPARLTIDGKTVLTVPAGRGRATSAVSLARGRHLIALEGAAVTHASTHRRVDDPRRRREARAPRVRFVAGVRTTSLAVATLPKGLFAGVTGGSVYDQYRLDGAIATCCLTDDVGARTSYIARWSGTLDVPRGGKYLVELFTQGSAVLRIDGKRVVGTPRRDGSFLLPCSCVPAAATPGGRCGIRSRSDPAGSNGGGFPLGDVRVLVSAVRARARRGGPTLGPPVPCACSARNPPAAPFVAR